MPKRPKIIKTYFCEVCHVEITTTKDGFEIHTQQHYIPDNSEHSIANYGDKRIINHYMEQHPPKRVDSEKECNENSERTKQVALVKSEPNETDSSFPIKKEVDDKNYNLLETDISASDMLICKETFNEPTELGSSIQSELSSPEPPNVNLEDDKFTELNDQAPAFIGSNPEMVVKHESRSVDVDQKEFYDYQCHVCHQNYMSASSLREHIMSSRGKCKLKCETCGECFLSATNLTSHRIANHERYVCNQCDESFFLLSSYEKHCSRSHIPTHVTKYMCKFCNKSYLHLAGYKTHIARCSQKRMEWYNEKQLFSCYICGKRFITNGYLETHIKTHTEDELSTCPSKQVFTNETESSIISAKSVMKRGEERGHVILPELDSDYFVSSIATIAHEEVIHENMEEQEHFILPESELDYNGPSIATVAYNQVIHENTEEQEDVILPESDPDYFVSSIATVAHEEVIQENMEEPENFILPESDPDYIRPSIATVYLYKEH